MAKDELPDLDAIVREVGWIDHKAKRSAELAYEQARAHYEPIVAELRERVEALTKQTWELGTRGDEAIEALDMANARIAELEAQLRHEEKRRAELDSENASLSTESDQVWLRATAAEDRVKELEAQLSRGVFVREMSDEELLPVFFDARTRFGARSNWVSPKGDIAGARACIAAATKLPEGAVRWGEDAFAKGGSLFNADEERIEGICVHTDSRGSIHHIYVPEVPNA